MYGNGQNGALHLQILFSKSGKHALRKFCPENIIKSKIASKNRMKKPLSSASEVKKIKRKKN